MNMSFCHGGDVKALVRLVELVRDEEWRKQLAEEMDVMLV